MTLYSWCDVDMEVCKDDINWKVTQLQSINSHPDNLQYQSHLGNRYPKCRIRESHWHHWNGGECPLPEGLEIRVQYRDKQRVEGRSWQFLKTSWKHSADVNNDIIAFKILGVMSGYKYEWENDNE